MKKYIIGSTSNLLEKNAAWSAFLKQSSLSFQSYGDISSGFMAPNDIGVIVVIFIEDLIQNSLSDYSLIEKANQAFFNLVEKRIMESDEPIIISLASRALKSAVASARNDTRLKSFHHSLITKLIKIRNTSNSVYFINMDDVFYEMGSEQIFSDRNWYFSRCRLSVDGLTILANSLAEIVNRINHPPKKMLVLDCDNTLWGGVVGEDGLHGLILGQDGLGQAFVDFQKECLRLSNEGVLLALASKNNEEDVWNVFENHPSMILKRDNIVCSKINWNEKSSNLLAMSNELDLGVDSFVFWDDNPIERNKVHVVLPEVLTIEAPSHVIEWPNLIRNLDCFSSFKVTFEDSVKSSHYKARANFLNDANQVNNINSYLSSINLSPVKLTLCDANLARAEQMCKKTNQFNLRTKRYSSSELLVQNSDPDVEIFLVGLKDDYGDHGLVALVGLRSVANGVVLIDTFLMSCRVLGRHLEAWILNEIIKLVKQKTSGQLLVDFIDSGKNEIAKEFLTSYGFKEEGDSALQFLKDGTSYNPEGSLCRLSDIDADIPNLEVYNGGNYETA
jgi:FkbH-like protein